MIANTATSTRESTRIYTLTANVLLVLVAIILAYFLIRIGLNAETFLQAAEGFPIWALLLSCAAYLTGHALRILRLALLIGGWRTGFRDIASVHMMTAAFSLTLPMKMGELYRIFELARIAGGGLKAVLIVLFERLFDMAVILMLLVGAMIVAPDAAGYLIVAALVGAFIAVNAVVFFLLPDNLRRLSILIIRRYDSPRSIPMLRVIDRVRRSILSAPYLVRGKIASLATLTVLIWTCETLCFVILLSPNGRQLTYGVEGLMSFLSAITSGETFLDLIATASDATILYLGASQAPLVIVGLVAAAYCIYRRARA